MPTEEIMKDLQAMFAPVSYDGVALWEVDSRVLNPFAEIPPVLTWATMNGRAAIPKRGIVAFSAKPKQGKSLSVYAMLIPLLSGAQFDAIEPTGGTPNRCIVFDTEMDIPTLTTRARAMQSVLGQKGKLFNVVPLLSAPFGDRCKIIDDVVSKYNPEIVVIDVVTRLLVNFNSEVESVELGNWLAQLAAERTVIIVIHQNKAADDNNMKGHLGSQANELQTESYTVVAEHGLFRVKPVSARTSYVDEDTKGYCFALDTEGKITAASGMLAAHAEEEKQRYAEYFSQIYGADECLKRGEIVKRIMTEEGISEREAERKITAAVKAGAISKLIGGKFAPYVIIGNPQNQPS